MPRRKREGLKVETTPFFLEFDVSSEMMDIVSDIFI